MRIRGVLFDLDGTLADTNPTHVEAWRRAFADFGHDIPADRIAGQIGKGGDNLVPALIPTDRAEADGPGLRDASKRHFIELAKQTRFSLTPGAVELVKAVRDRGLTTALATSSNEDHLKATFGSLGTDLRKLVDQSTTADDAEKSKPHPDLVTAAADKLGLPPAACVLVGDTPYDGQAATKVGCRFWAVLTGGFTADDLKNAGADGVFRDPADLLARLDEALERANEAPTISHLEALMAATNPTPPDDKSGLRGGTLGGRAAPLVDVEQDYGATDNTNAPQAGNAPGGGRRGSRTDDRDDPHRVHEDGTRRPGAGASIATARDEADVPEEVSRNGINENDPRQIGPGRKPRPGTERPLSNG